MFQLGTTGELMNLMFTDYKACPVGGTDESVGNYIYLGNFLSHLHEM
jgi:hypothetical protein